jgi:hypothetical protein
MWSQATEESIFRIQLLQNLKPHTDLRDVTPSSPKSVTAGGYGHGANFHNFSTLANRPFQKHNILSPGSLLQLVRSGFLSINVTAFAKA